MICGRWSRRSIWLGGVHLVPPNPRWRWDEEQQTLARVDRPDRYFLKSSCTSSEKAEWRRTKHCCASATVKLSSGASQ